MILFFGVSFFLGKIEENKEEINVIEEADEQDTENVDVEDDAIDTSEIVDNDNVEDVEGDNENFEESTEETECDGSMNETSDEVDNNASFENAED